MGLTVVSVAISTTGCLPKPKQYSLKGQVLEISASGEIIVKHEDIPGFMPAMTMPYKVRDPDVLQEVEPGGLIAAALMVAKNGNYWLEDVRITESLPHLLSQRGVVPFGRMLADGSWTGWRRAAGPGTF